MTAPIHLEDLLRDPAPRPSTRARDGAVRLEDLLQSGDSDPLGLFGDTTASGGTAPRSAPASPGDDPLGLFDSDTDVAEHASTPLYEQYLRETGRSREPAQGEATPLYEQYRREMAQRSAENAPTSPQPSPSTSAASTATPAPRRERLDPVALAARVREGVARVRASADATAARPTYTPGTQFESEEQRRASAPPLPARVAQGVGHFAKEAVTHPVETAKAIVLDPLKSAERTFLRPVEGETVTPTQYLRGKSGPVPGSLKPGTVITKENSPSAISRKEFNEAAFQTTANAIAAPLGAGAGKVGENLLAKGLTRSLAERGIVDVSEATALREGARRAGGVLGGAVAAAPVGAAYDPEHPVEGALTLATIGTLLHPVHEVATPAVKRAGRAVSAGLDNVREVGERVSERVRAERAERAAKKVANLTERPDEAPTGEREPAPEEIPPAPPAQETTRPTMRRRIAETIDPSISERLRAAERHPLTGLQSKEVFNRLVEEAEKQPGTSIASLDITGFKIAQDAPGHGHQWGDERIREAGAAVEQAARENGVRAFHPSGDEFAFIGESEAVKRATERASELYGVKDHGNGIKTSLAGGSGSTLAEAEAGMYSAKERQRAEHGIANRSGERGEVRTEPIESIDVEPERFQHRESVDARTGVTKQLEGPFNRKASGVMLVWRDPVDGRLKLVNGHHRFDLAQRSGEQTVDIRELQAKSAGEARLQGAMVNIIEGNATPFEAASLFRDSGLTLGDVRAMNLPVGKALIEQGMSIAKLAPDLWERVRKGEIPETTAAAIGTVLDTPEQQRAAAKLIGDERLTRAEAENVARQVKDAGSETVTQETLFGTEESALSLAVPKAKLIEAVKRAIGRDARTFGFVAREGRAEELARGGNVIDREGSAQIAQEAAQAAEVFDRLATRAGPVSQILTEGARRVARGERLATVAADIRAQLREAVSEALARGQGESLTGDAAAGGPNARERGTTPGEAGRGVAPPSPDQRALLAPAHEGPDLFGEETAREPAQENLFLGSEGTAASRSLSETERAARAELPKLREQLRLETDRGRRASIAGRIAKLEALINRAEKIGAEEGAARAIAGSGETPTTPTGPEQQSLFDAASRGSPIAQQTAQATGASPADVKRVKALIEIGRDLSRAVGVPTRQGRFRASARRALGVFFPHGKVTRVVRLDKLDTIAHEIGHYVSQEHLGNPTMKKSLGSRRVSGLTQAMAKELEKMGRDLYGTRQPAAGYGEEGIAQWFRFYVTDPAKMLRDAPQFTAFMEQLFQREPDMKFLQGALDRARGDFELWQKAPAQARIRAMISVGEHTRWRPTVRGFVSAMIDDLHEFTLAEREIARASGAPLNVSARRSAEALARLSRGSAGMAEEMVERGIGDPDNPAAGRISEGLTPVLERVGRENIEDFRDYLVAVRALELAGRGIDSGFEVKDAAKAVVDLQDRFRDEAAKVWEYGQALIEYRRDAGLLTAKEAETILKKNEHYVPFQRLFHEEETGRSAGRGGRRNRFAYNSSGIQSIKGSGRTIIDPFESLIEQTYRTVRDVQQHRAAQALIELSNKTPGGAQVIERLTERPVRKVELSVVEVIDQLEDLGFTIDPNATPAELQKMADGVLTGFRELQVGGAKEAKDLVIPVIENGKRQWYAVKDRALFEALQGLGTQTVPMWARFLTAPARTLRAGATLTLEFLGRNPVRDAWSAAVYSQAGFRAPGWNLAKGLFHALRKDELYQRWRLAGGDNATMLGLDRMEIQKHINDVLEKRTPVTFAADVVRHPIDTLRLLSSLGENASRLGEFQAVEQQARRQGASAADAATEAALAARNVTLDFARAGTYGRVANQIVAFFNANLQGTAKLVHELKTRPQVIIPRAVASITVPSIALYLLNRNDPAYQELPQWQKDTFWIIVQRDENGELQHLWRIPKPFELGVLFGTVPERIMQRIEKDDPEAFRDLGNRLVQTFLPIPWPTVGSALTPVVENIANRDFFTDRPIVPASTEDLVPSEQVAPHTGEFARQVGRALDYSPAKILHTVTGYTAGLGRIGLGIANAATREGRKAAGLEPLTPPLVRHERDRLAGAPGIRAFVARPPGTEAESITRFYDAFESAESKRRTWQKMLKDRRIDEARSFLRANRKEIAAVATGSHPGRLREAKAKMDELRVALRKAQAGAPTGQRARTVERIENQMIRLAQLALGRKAAGAR